MMNYDYDEQELYSDSKDEKIYNLERQVEIYKSVMKDIYNILLDIEDYDNDIENIKEMLVTTEREVAEYE